MKRKIKQNIWGNWKGYEGTRKVADFGTDEREATAWAAGGQLPPEFDWNNPPKTPHPPPVIKFKKHPWE
jgi:hypothetical protein